MFDLTFMREEITLPSITRFQSEPNSLSLAAAAIWAVDAYASHAAFAAHKGAIDEKRRPKVETDFKNCVYAGAGVYAWKFRVLRETSNALKHASRSENALVSNSALIIRDVDRRGWSAWIARDTHWGHQVVVDLNLQFDEVDNEWKYNQKSFGGIHGPFFKEVPVLEILKPSVTFIDDMVIKSQ